MRFSSIILVLLCAAMDLFLLALVLRMYYASWDDILHGVRSDYPLNQRLFTDGMVLFMTFLGFLISACLFFVIGA